MGNIGKEVVTFLPPETAKHWEIN